MHTFHLAKPGVFRVARALLRPPTSVDVPGLKHAECMTPMRLGAAIFSPGRWQFGRLAMFASWENEDAVDAFLSDTLLGRTFAAGWHVRLEFLRRWGYISEFDGLPQVASETDPDAPVVAVTLARLRLSQALRFVRWGKPVETLVRDHPGTTFALAASRPPHTLSTFTIWRTAREMSEMVHGRSSVASPERHSSAMVERERKDFHTQFTTLRFRCVSEHGEWGTRGSVMPR